MFAFRNDQNTFGRDRLSAGRTATEIRRTGFRKHPLKAVQLFPGLVQGRLHDAFIDDRIHSGNPPDGVIRGDGPGLFRVTYDQSFRFTDLFQQELFQFVLVHAFLSLFQMLIYDNKPRHAI